jgi:hypothetical protein
MIAHDLGQGTATESDGTTTMSYPMSLSSTSITANIGKRWMLTDHVNVTARIGLGWAHYEVASKDTSADAQNAVQVTNALLTLFPIGVDGELSVGYTF